MHLSKHNFKFIGLCIIFFMILMAAFVLPKPVFAETDGEIFPVQAAESSSWELSIRISDEQTTALSDPQYGILDNLSNHQVVYAVESGWLNLSGSQGMEQLRQVLFEDLDPVIDFLSGKITLTVFTPTTINEITDLRLESRISTGYQWFISDEKSGSFQKIGESTNEPYFLGPGSSGIQHLQTLSVSNGKNSLSLTYQRPFEKDEAVHVELTIRFTDNPTIFDLTNPNPPQIITTPDTSETKDNPVDDIILADTLPTSFDWRDYGVVPAVRSQGGCGSCWAFGTVGVMESAIKISGGPMTDLSEQFLISCNNSGFDCDGGLTAHDYHYNTLGKNQTAIGAVLEADKPYSQSNGTCTVAYNHPYKLDDWEFVTGTEWEVPTVEQIKNAIYTYGPVTAGVCAGDNFDNYTSGVMTVGDNPNIYCGGYTNHQIILVGWDDATGSWILRNTWGANWGEDGYMRIKYGISRVGEGPSWVTYVGDTPSIPTAPSGLSASDGTYTDKVAVSWNTVSSATYYQVYRSTSNNSGGASLLTASTTANPYNDTSAVPGTTYYYWVKACNANGCSVFSTSDSGWRSSAVIPTAPSGLSASDGTYTDKIAVSWNTVTSATYYQVYRSTSNTSGGASQLTASTTANPYNDTSAVPGTVYYYWVKACNANGCSAFSTSDSGWRVSTTITAPNTVSASDGTYSDKVRITWTAVGGASYYQVYRNSSNNSSGASQLISNLTTTSYDDSSVISDTSYYYWVKTCNTNTCSGFSPSDSGYAVSTRHIFLPLILRVESSTTSSIKNGDFENGQNGDWTEISSNGWDLITTDEEIDGLTAHSGSWLAWLGGDANETSRLSQSVSVPSATPVLHYWYWSSSEDLCGFDYFSIKVDGSTKQTLNLCESNNTGGWVEGSLNLSQYSGSSVNLMFEVTTNDSYNSGLLLDDISFSASLTTSPKGLSNFENNNKNLQRSR